MAAAVLLLTGIAAWTCGQLLQREVERATSRGFETVAVQTAGKIDQLLLDRRHLLQFVARRVATIPADRADLLRDDLDALLESQPDLAWAGLADHRGTVIAASQRQFERSSVERTLWFRSGQRAPSVGAIREVPELASLAALADDNSARVLEMAVPVVTSGHAAVGVLGAYLRWTAVHDIVRSVVPDTLSSEHVGVTLYDGAGVPLLDTGGLGWTQPPDAPAGQTGAGPSGVFVERSLPRITCLTGYARVAGSRDGRGAGWMIAVRQPLSDVLAPVGRLRREILLGGTLLAIVFAELGWLLAMPVSRQLRRIATAAARIEQGDVLAMLPAEPGSGELARACDALRRLIERLRSPAGETPQSNPGRPAPLPRPGDSDATGPGDRPPPSRP